MNIPDMNDRDDSELS